MQIGCNGVLDELNGLIHERTLADCPALPRAPAARRRRGLYRSEPAPQFLGGLTNQPPFRLREKTQDAGGINCLHVSAVGRPLCPDHRPKGLAHSAGGLARALRASSAHGPVRREAGLQPNWDASAALTFDLPPAIDQTPAPGCSDDAARPSGFSPF